MAFAGGRPRGRSLESGGAIGLKGVGIGMTTGSTDRKPWHRRLAFRLSVRGLIALVFLFGGSLGWWLHLARVQREAVAFLSRRGVGIDYGGQYFDGSYRYAETTPPGWLVDLVGYDALRPVIAIGTQPNANPAFGDDEMAAVGRLDHLEVFGAFDALNLTDAGLARLRGNLRLKQLIIGHSARLTGPGLAHLSTLYQLEDLQYPMTRLHDADLAPLAGLSRLRELILTCGEGSTVGDAGLEHLAGLRELRTLGIDGYSKFSNEGLALIGGMGRLEHLSLNGSRITDLKGLAPLVGLKSLNLMRVPVDDAGMAPIARFPGLMHLTLADNPAVTDAGLVHLQGLADLQSLDLRNCRVTDAGLAHILGCPRLVYLDLSGTQLSDAGLALLVKNKRYSFTGVSKTRVTPEGVRAAKAIRPGQAIRD